MGKITTNPGEKKPAEPEVQVEPTAPLPQKVTATELPLPVTMTTAPPRRNRRCCVILLLVLIVVMIGVSITLGALYMKKHHGRDHDRPEHDWDGENDGDWDELMGGGKPGHSGEHRPRPWHHSGEHRPGHHGSSSSEEHGHRPYHRPGHRPYRPHRPWPRPSGEPRPPRPSGEPRPTRPF